MRPKSKCITLDCPFQHPSSKGLIASSKGQFWPLCPDCWFKSPTSFLFAFSDGGFAIVNVGLIDDHAFRRSSAVWEDPPSTININSRALSFGESWNNEFRFPPNLLIYDNVLSLASSKPWYCATPNRCAKTSLACSGDRVGGFEVFGHSSPWKM